MYVDLHKLLCKRLRNYLITGKARGALAQDLKETKVNKHLIVMLLQKSFMKSKGQKYYIHYMSYVDKNS